ncbi:MAG: type VI secretion system lipoprotein TssJ [Pseudodesulfovibrio sp.]
MYCKSLVFIFLVVSTLVAAGCGGGQPKPKDPSTVTSPASSPAEIKWTYQVNAISMELRADKKLNEYDGSPHTLLLCVYQLSDTIKFKELAGTSTGLTKLYDCKSFDKSVTHVQRVFVQPDHNATETMDRAEGTKYVGVAAGYYDLQGGGATRTWQIPMDTTETGVIFFKDTWYAPAKLEAILVLGPHEIQKVGE